MALKKFHKKNVDKKVNLKSLNLAFNNKIKLQWKNIIFWFFNIF